MTTDRKQVALVTGGRSGIGLACACEFAKEGAAVAGLDYDELLNVLVELGTYKYVNNL